MASDLLKSLPACMALGLFVSHCSLALDFDALSAGEIIEPDTECLDDLDCDDGILCTEEQCNDEKLCDRSTNNALCTSLEMCDLEKGCIPSGQECTKDRHCEDQIDCTDDFCLSNECFNRPLDYLCDKGDLCILSWNCDPTDGCMIEEEQTCTDPDPTASPCIRGVCNSSTGDCELETVPGADDDTDSYLDHLCGGGDCDDSRSDINPDASEICNALDDNCDGVTDEGC